MIEMRLGRSAENCGGLSRRDFVGMLMGGSALSLTALDKLNELIYRSIDDLNQDCLQNPSPDGIYWDELKKYFLLHDRLIMMNNGTVGPMPKPVFNTLVKYFRIQVTNPYDVYNFYPSRKDEVRGKLARFINASVDEVVLSRNTTEGARKFETVGQRADPIIFAYGEALDFQARIGTERIERRIKTLASYLKKELETIDGVRLHTSHDPYLSGGLTAFSIEGVEPSWIVDYLREKYNIVIRTVGSQSAGTAGVRVSTHIFVSTGEVDMVLEGVKYLAERA